MYRNGIKLNGAPITASTYEDNMVPSGQYTYCVKALYLEGESDGNCTNVDVAVGIEDPGKKQFTVFPNPASSVLKVYSGIAGEFQIVDFSGMAVKTGRVEAPVSTIDISDLPAGIYIIRIPLSGIANKFVKIN
jgi:hypothetical protein